MVVAVLLHQAPLDHLTAPALGALRAFRGQVLGDHLVALGLVVEQHHRARVAGGRVQRVLHPRFPRVGVVQHVAHSFSFRGAPAPLMADLLPRVPLPLAHWVVACPDAAAEAGGDDRGVTRVAAHLVHDVLFVAGIDHQPLDAIGRGVVHVRPGVADELIHRRQQARVDRAGASRFRMDASQGALGVGVAKINALLVGIRAVGDDLAAELLGPGHHRKVEQSVLHVDEAGQLGGPGRHEPAPHTAGLLFDFIGRGEFIASLKRLGLVLILGGEGDRRTKPQVHGVLDRRDLGVEHPVGP